jgi:hypothetical protein
MAEEKEKKKPTHEIFFVQDTGKKDEEGKGKGFWDKIGAGWENQDGSINLSLTLWPLKPGTIQIRKFKEKTKE